MKEKIVGLKDIADFLVLSESAIQDLVKKKIVIKVGRGKYKLIESFQNYIGTFEPSTTQATLETETIRLRSSQADLAERQLKKFEDNHVLASEAEVAKIEMAKKVKGEILKMVKPLATACSKESDPKKTYKILNTAFCDKLTELSS